MIADVFLDHATYADLPHKFEGDTWQSLIGRGRWTT